MVFCLRADNGRPLFGWFDLSDNEKLALVTKKKLLGDDIELDMEGLRKMLEAFLQMTDPAQMDDRDRDPWANVANNRSRSSRTNRIESPAG